MDAHALLTSQGWRGTGHSLHPTSDHTGLSKPLLVSRKINNLGVGKKQHKTADLWWMNAFDKSLKGLETSALDTGEVKVVQTVSNGGLDMVVRGGAKWVGNSGGLYASFVRGEGLGGTITPDTEGSGSAGEDRGKRRRKDGESKEERRARKAAKRAARLQISASEGTLEIEATVETKETRRARRAADKASKKQESPVEEEPENMKVDEATEKVQTKEERREQKRQKKLLKEAEQALEEAASSKAQKKKRRKD